MKNIKKLLMCSLYICIVFLSIKTATPLYANSIVVDPGGNKEAPSGSNYMDSTDTNINDTMDLFEESFNNMNPNNGDKSLYIATQQTLGPVTKNLLQIALAFFPIWFLLQSALDIFAMHLTILRKPLGIEVYGSNGSGGLGSGSGTSNSERKGITFAWVSLDLYRTIQVCEGSGASGGLGGGSASPDNEPPNRMTYYLKKRSYTVIVSLICLTLIFTPFGWGFLLWIVQTILGVISGVFSSIAGHVKL